MDAGQIIACFIVGGVFMVFTKLAVEILDTHNRFSDRTKYIIEYFATVIGVAIVFSVGLVVGRQ
jgi:hypothetical protein